MEVDLFKQGATKRCVFGDCKTDSRTSSIAFIPFPKPCLAFRKHLVNGDKKHIKQCSLCGKSNLWLSKCKRSDYCKLEHVKKWHYICVLHFVNEIGPTAQNCYPLPASEAAFTRRIKLTARKGRDRTEVGAGIDNPKKNRKGGKVKPLSKGYANNHPGEVSSINLDYTNTSKPKVYVLSFVKLPANTAETSETQISIEQLQNHDQKQAIQNIAISDTSIVDMTTKRPNFGRGKILRSQARSIIENVIDFMKEEAEAYHKTGGSIIPLSNYKQRVMTATGISEKMYRTILKEAKAVRSGREPTFRSPKRKNLEDHFSSDEEIYIDYTENENNVDDPEISIEFVADDHKVYDPLNNFDEEGSFVKTEIEYCESNNFVKIEPEVISNFHSNELNETNIKSELIEEAFIRQEIPSSDK